MRIVRHLKSAPFTWLMAATIIVVFAVTRMSSGDPEAKALFTPGSMVTDSFLAGEWWLLFTSKLMHHDWDHVLWNAAGLIVVGLLLEPKLGTGRTALLYFLGMIGSAVGTLACQLTGSLP